MERADAVGHHRREERKRRLRPAVRLLAPRDSGEVKSLDCGSGFPQVREGWPAVTPMRATLVSAGGGVENINVSEEAGDLRVAGFLRSGACSYDL